MERLPNAQLQRDMAALIDLVNDREPDLSPERLRLDREAEEDSIFEILNRGEPKAALPGFGARLRSLLSRAFRQRLGA